MENEVIEVLDLEHGQKVKKYWDDRGFDTSFYRCNVNRKEGASSFYYGVINGMFSNFSMSEVENHKAKIITLPNEKTFPRKMWVWNQGINPKKNERIVLGIYNGIAVAINLGNEGQFNKGDYFGCTAWECCAEIEEEPEIILSMQEIADKFNVSVDKLKIKK